MREARIGDRVRVHVTEMLGDGTLIESSRGSEPLEFTLGKREVMTGLDEMVRGMRSGEVRTGRVPPDQAHGRHRTDLLLAVERERFPTHIDPYTGQQLSMKRGELPAIVVTVLATTADLVLLDTNHPLAGKELVLEVELLAIENEPSSMAC